MIPALPSGAKSGRRAGREGSLPALKTINHGMAEQRRLQVQAELDRRKTARERNQIGQFATPRLLAVDIAREVSRVAGLESSPLCFGEPSIGSGAFYSALLEVFGTDRIA